MFLFSLLLFISGILVLVVGIKSIKEKVSIPPLGQRPSWFSKWVNIYKVSGRDAVLSGIIYLLISVIMISLAIYSIDIYK